MQQCVFHCKKVWEGNSERKGFQFSFCQRKRTDIGLENRRKGLVQGTCLRQLCIIVRMPTHACLHVLSFSLFLPHVGVGYVMPET